MLFSVQNNTKITFANIFMHVSLYFLPYTVFIRVCVYVFCCSQVNEFTYICKCCVNGGWMCPTAQERERECVRICEHLNVILVHCPVFTTTTTTTISTSIHTFLLLTLHIHTSIYICLYILKLAHTYMRGVWVHDIRVKSSVLDLFTSCADWDQTARFSH